MSATTASAATRSEPGPAADRQLSHRQILGVLSGLMLGMFLAALDQTIVASAIRTIGDDLHGLSIQAWVTTAYLITATISTPLYGKLSDIYGRKPFFLTAITIFVIGSAACSFSTSMYMLAGFRALQGLGAGGLFSLALAIIGDIVPPRERARYQGYFLAVFGTSSVLGPVIGGFFAGTSSILTIAGWRWVFLVNVPIGIVALAVVAKVLNVPHTRREQRIDWFGALTLTIGLVPLLTVAEQGRVWGWGSQRAILCYAVGAAGLLAFIAAEARAKEDALIPLRMFRNRTFSLTAITSIVTGMGMFGVLVSLPLYLQIVRNATPTESGLQLLPLTAGIMIGSILSGQLISRTGRYRIFPIIGSLLMVVGAWLLHLLSVDTEFWRTAVYMAVFGFGLGNIMQPITLAVQNAMPPQDIGVATSSATFFRQMGGTLGTAVFLSVLFSTVAGKIADAFREAAATPAFQAVINNPAVTSDPANAPVVSMLRSGGALSSASLNDTSFIQRLNPVLARPIQIGFAESMDLVYLLAAAVLVIAFVLLLFLPEIPLRTQSAMAAREPASPLGERPPVDPAGPEDAGSSPDDAPPERPERDEATPDGYRAVHTATGAFAALSNVAVLDGRVAGPDGHPIAGAMLTVTDLHGNQVARDSSDAAGRYRLGLPTGGTYLLICAEESHQPVASMVIVAAGEVHRDIVLVGASRIEGRVLRQNGEPIDAAAVTLTDARGDVVGATVSGPAGEYVLADLYPGDYTLTATADGTRPAARNVTAEGVSAHEVDVVLLSNGSLAGTVRAASTGLPVRDASVTAVDGYGDVVATAITGDDGRYEFNDLLPAAYTVTASGYAPVATRVDLADDRTERDLTLGQATAAIPPVPAPADRLGGR
jgi:EmrB/QacA subfamily drug resistance transporter